MFLDVRQFGFVNDLQAAWREIRDEYLALPEDAFEPWVQREMYGEGWSVYGLYAFGRRIDTRVVLLFDFLRPGASEMKHDEPPAEVRYFVNKRARKL